MVWLMLHSSSSLSWTTHFGTCLTNSWSLEIKFLWAPLLDQFCCGSSPSSNEYLSRKFLAPSSMVLGGGTVTTPLNSLHQSHSSYNSLDFWATVSWALPVLVCASSSLVCYSAPFSFKLLTPVFPFVSPIIEPAWPTVLFWSPLCMCLFSLIPAMVICSIMFFCLSLVTLLQLPDSSACF